MGTDSSTGRELLGLDVAIPALVDHAPIGIGMIAPDRSLAYANQALRRITDGEQADDAALAMALLGARRWDGSAYPTGLNPIDRTLEGGVATSGEEMIVQRPGGQNRRISLDAAPMRDKNGTVVGAVAYVDDITDRHHDESLGEAFVAVLSHEFRTPLTSIYGGTQLLLRGRMGAGERSSVIEDIALEAEHLQRLVEDMLAVVRLGQGEPVMSRDPVLLQRVAVTGAASERRRWPGRDIEMEIEPDLPAVRGEEGYVLQVVRNLITSAMTNSPEGTAVQITVRRVDEGVEVAILDRGPRFAEELGDDVFSLFHQHPQIAARIPVTGIGLYVARALVEAMNGRIRAGEGAGGTTEISFELPFFPFADRVV